MPGETGVAGRRMVDRRVAREGGGAVNSGSDLAVRSVTAVFWNYVGAILRICASLVAQLALARLLGPQAFGQAAAAMIVLTFGWLLSEGGFGAALIQKAELRDRDISYALGWVLCMSCSVGLGVVVGSPWLAGWLGGAALAPLLIAAGVLIPVQAVSNIPVSLMRRELDAKRAQLINLGAYLMAYLGIGVSMAWLGQGAWSLVAAFGAHSVINLLGCYAVTRHTLRPSLRGDAAVGRFGFQVTLTTVANWATENLDRLIINRCWGSVALGEYTAAMALSRAPATFLTGAIQGVAFSSASRIQNDPARLSRAYVAMLNLLSLASWPLFALLALHAQGIVLLLYGLAWADAVPLFAALCMALPWIVALSLSGPLLWAMGAVRRDVEVQTVTALLLFAGLWLLADRPLAQAVWCLPGIYLLRAIWFHGLVARRLQVGGLTLAALRGGGAAVALVGAVSLLAAAALPELPALAVAASCGPLLVAFAVRQWPRFFFCDELRELLLGQASASAMVRRLCRWLALTPPIVARTEG